MIVAESSVTVQPKADVCVCVCVCVCACERMLVYNAVAQQLTSRCHPCRPHMPEDLCSLLYTHRQTDRQTDTHREESRVI